MMLLGRLFPERTESVIVDRIRCLIRFFLEFTYYYQDSDVENLSQETLQKQYTIVKAETTTSAVHEYGNLTMGTSFRVSQFQVSF